MSFARYATIEHGIGGGPQLGEISGLHAPFANMTIGMVVKFDDGLVASIAIHLTMIPCTDDSIAKNVTLSIVVYLEDLVEVGDEKTHKLRGRLWTFVDVGAGSVHFCS